MMHKKITSCNSITENIVSTIYLLSIFILIMKLRVTIQPTIKKGKAIVKDLKAIKELEKYYKEINGEAAYFYEFEGHKTFEFFIDISKPEKISEIADPMFKKFDARILFQPVVTFDDLKKDSVKKKRRSKK